MSDVDTSGDERRRNKRWPEAVKREIVAATSLPGASVSVVARQYGVNANQVFAWRRRFREADKAAASSPSGERRLVVMPWLADSAL
jgi:transposase-like protein